MVVFESDIVKVFEDLFGVRVFLDRAVAVKAYHVGSVYGRAEFELRDEAFLYGVLELVGWHMDDEMDMFAGVMFLVLLWIMENHTSDPKSEARSIGPTHRDEAFLSLSLLILVITLILILVFALVRRGTTNDARFEELLVVFGPTMDWKLSDLDSGVRELCDGTGDDELVWLRRIPLNSTLTRIEINKGCNGKKVINAYPPVSEPGCHWHTFSTLHESPQI